MKTNMTFFKKRGWNKYSNISRFYIFYATNPSGLKSKNSALCFFFVSFFASMWKIWNKFTRFHRMYWMTSYVKIVFCYCVESFRISLLTHMSTFIKSHPKIKIEKRFVSRRNRNNVLTKNEANDFLEWQIESVWHLSTHENFSSFFFQSFAAFVFSVCRLLRRSETFCFFGSSRGNRRIPHFGRVDNVPKEFYVSFFFRLSTISHSFVSSNPFIHFSFVCVCQMPLTRTSFCLWQSSKTNR